MGPSTEAPTLAPLTSPRTSSSYNASPASTKLTRENMPWLCNGCGLTAAQGLDELARMAGNESAVSYIQYFVTSSGTFYCQCPDATVATGRALGLNVLPMINSGDTAGADALALIQHRNWWGAFIQSALATANASGYAGYNWDIEGTGSGTPPTNTSSEYAHLLWQFANATHAAGLRTTVDVAWFDPQLWNATYLSATSVDVFYDMDYYSWTYFWDRLYKDLGQYPRDRLGEGLAGDVGNGVPCPGDVGAGGFNDRIHILESYNITRTAFWAMADWAVGNGCWDYPPGVGALLHDFLFNGSTSANWTLEMGGGPNGWAFCPGGWSVSGAPPVGTCAPSSPDGLNVTLYTSNDTGSIGPVTLQGNSSITRSWGTPLSSLRLDLFEYLDGRNLTLTQQNLSCAGGAVVSSGPLPTPVGWLHRDLVETFPAGAVCGLRFILARDVPGPGTGENDWFANFAIQLPAGPLSVRATGTPLTGTAPLAVTFAGNVTGGLAPITYGWDLGDGSTTSTLSPTHTFAAPGTYLATLSATDAAGLTRSANLTVQVAPTNHSVPLSVSASASPPSGVAPLPVRFSAVVQGGQAPYAVRWHFGDGGTASQLVVNHTYLAAGTFDAQLVVNDSAGGSTSAVLSIVVAAAPPLSVSARAAPATVPEGASVTFSAAVTGGRAPFTYQWQGLPPGCPSQNAAALTCTPTVTGPFSVVVAVADASIPVQHANGSTTLNVTASPGGATASPALPWSDLLVGGLLVGTLLALAVVLLLRRRRAHPPAEPPEQRDGPS